MCPVLSMRQLTEVEQTLSCFVLTGHSECLEVLISWGIDVDQDLPHLGTPLYVACVSQQIHCIRKLLYAGMS